MNVAEIASPAAAAAAPRQGDRGLSPRSQLSRQDFYKIMIAEMTNQDPFKPLDNKQFLDQVASLQTLDATGRLNDAVDRLVLGQELGSASALIGKHVRALDEDGAEIEGTVERLRVRDGEVALVLEGDREVKLDRLVEVAIDGQSA